MNREIKFRAWDKGHNKMVYRVNLYSFNREGVMDKAQLENQQVMKGIGFACEIMQATGLKDKNGIEIYEGDILATKGISDVTVYWYEQEARWQLRYHDTLKDCDLNDTISRTSKVIGNIYENKSKSLHDSNDEKSD